MPHYGNMRDRDRGQNIPVPRLSISQQFDELHGQISALDNQIEEINNNVKFFSVENGDTTPVGLDPKVPIRNNSNLEEAILNISQRINNMSAKLCDINARLRP